MNNKRSCCGIAGAVGIILGMVPMMTTACVPGYDVVLHGYDPEWAHVACAYGHDGMVFNGSADNWSYWYYSYSTEKAYNSLLVITLMRHVMTMALTFMVYQ